MFSFAATKALASRWALMISFLSPSEGGFVIQENSEVNFEVRPLRWWTLRFVYEVAKAHPESYYLRSLCKVKRRDHLPGYADLQCFKVFEIADPLDESACVLKPYMKDSIGDFQKREDQAKDSGVPTGGEVCTCHSVLRGYVSYVYITGVSNCESVSLPAKQHRLGPVWKCSSN